MRPSATNVGVRAFLDTVDEPTAWEFFAFVRWVEGSEALRGERVGYAGSLEDELILFRQATYTEFAPASIKDIQRSDERKRGPAATLVGYFLGLLGPSGPMPFSLTEYVWARSNGVQHPDRTTARLGGMGATSHRSLVLEDFLNIFNHRFIAFFYRAWASCRIAVDFDRPDRAKFPNFIGSFIGMGMPSLRRRLEPLHDEAIFHFTAHFANHSRHPEGLEAIVSDYFETPAVVLENAGHWLDLPESDQCRLGAVSMEALGEGIPIGSRIWDRQLRFVLRLGPMSLRCFESLLPGTIGLDTLRRVVMLYTRRELFCTLQLVLERSEAPEPRLGSGVRLGLSTWLLNPESEDQSDLDELTIDLN
jgi:type VI secretion system protein ImpH